MPPHEQLGMAFDLAIDRFLGRAAEPPLGAVARPNAYPELAAIRPAVAELHQDHCRICDAVTERFQALIVLRDRKAAEKVGEGLRRVPRRASPSNLKRSSSPFRQRP